MGIEKYELLFMLDDIKSMIDEAPKEKIKEKYDKLHKQLIGIYSLMAE